MNFHPNSNFFLSRSSQISQLCRLIRTDDKEVRNTALKIIRNFSMVSSAGFAVLLSNDFMETIDTILSDECKNLNEKLLILQTLLCIASKSEQMRSKLKNSPFSRKFKDNLMSLETLGDDVILSLTKMLNEILYMK